MLHDRSVEKTKAMAPILAFIALLALIAVSFAIYKAVTAFSGTVESPAYESQPPGAVVSSIPFTITKDLEGSVRLADAALFRIYSVSEGLAQKAVDGKLSKGDLVAAGMEARDAAEALAEARSTRPGNAEDLEKTDDINGENSISGYTIRIPYRYDLGGVPGAAYVDLSWEAGDGINARLSSISVAWQ